MMESRALVKVAAKMATEVCGRFPVGEEAKQLLRDNLTPAQYLELLIDKQAYVDATRFLAHALPKREAVWWACLCARKVYGTNPLPKIAAALQAAERWVADPSEDNRRAAMTAAEAAEFSTPAGCAAVAAFWSGGSLGPPNVPAIPPGEQLTAHGVAGAVMLAAVLAEPEKAPEKYRQFFALGREVASGMNFPVSPRPSSRGSAESK
jgi:hypothetical protein